MKLLKRVMAVTDKCNGLNEMTGVTSREEEHHLQMALLYNAVSLCSPGGCKSGGLTPELAEATNDIYKLLNKHFTGRSEHAVLAAAAELHCDADTEEPF